MRAFYCDECEHYCNLVDDCSVAASVSHSQGVTIDDDEAIIDYGDCGDNGDGEWQDATCQECDSNVERQDIPEEENEPVTTTRRPQQIAQPEQFMYAS